MRRYIYVLHSLEFAFGSCFQEFSFWIEELLRLDTTHRMF